MSSLEADIIKWIAAHNADFRWRLLAQFESAEITKREYSGAGWFIHFHIPTNMGGSQIEPIDRTTLDGPNIEGPGLEGGGGCVLFLKNGFLDFLEIYAFGNVFPKELPKYKLSETYN